MALYQATDFSGSSDSYAVRSVDLILSTGTTQQIFGTLAAAQNAFIL